MYRCLILVQGSGKTLAYGLPILNGLLTDPGQDTKYVRALILAPTRELAIQVKDHLAAVARFTKLKVVAIVGGLATQKQVRLLSKIPDVLVATPGRLNELLNEVRALVMTLLRFLTVW